MLFIGEYYLLAQNRRIPKFNPKICKLERGITGSRFSLVLLAKAPARSTIFLLSTIGKVKSKFNSSTVDVALETSKSLEKELV